MTTVTIDDTLRRKLKALAAKYDTTQAEIIRRSLESFENNENCLEIPDPPVNSSKHTEKDHRLQIEQYLQTIQHAFAAQYPDLAALHRQIAQHLQENPDDLQAIQIHLHDLTDSR